MVQTQALRQTRPSRQRGAGPHAWASGTLQGEEALPPSWAGEKYPARALLPAQVRTYPRRDPPPQLRQVLHGGAWPQDSLPGCDWAAG